MIEPSELINQSLVDEKELWKNYYRYRKGGNGKYHRNKLVEYHLPLLINIAEKIAWRQPSYIELDDLIQEGAPGLIKAVEEYDENRGTKFNTHAFIRIRRAIFESLRKIYQFYKFRDRQAEASLTDALEVDNTSIVDELQKKELYESMTYLMKGLTREELSVIKRYYFENKTLKEIGKIMDISPQAVQQKRDKILRTLEDRARRKKLGLENFE